MAANQFLSREGYDMEFVYEKGYNLVFDEKRNAEGVLHLIPMGEVVHLSFNVAGREFMDLVRKIGPDAAFKAHSCEAEALKSPVPIPPPPTPPTQATLEQELEKQRQVNRALKRKAGEA
jgi:hypothetical protein